jgi:DNA (cytosine-5)-methyltransferase 1
VRQPRLLDLFCGAGGATRGYQDAGFHVTGVDIEPQPNYCGDDFYQYDAIAWLEEAVLTRFDVIHASPPCQRYSAMASCRPGLAETYPDLIAPTRDLLEKIGMAYVIENVPGAPLRADATLCGQMFGLDLYRHRLFESNVPLDEPEHPGHVLPASRAGHWTPGTVMSVSGHVAPIAHARKIMGIDWTTRAELAEAIPPAYTQFIGERLIGAMQ